MKSSTARRRSSAERTLAVDATRMQRHAGNAARLLKALANDKRLQILCLLAEGERSVGDLNALLDLSQSALSQHLAVLRADGIVRTRREAQTIHYGLAEGPAQRVIQTLHDFYCGTGRTSAA